MPSKKLNQQHSHLILVPCTLASVTNLALSILIWSPFDFLALISDASLDMVEYRFAYLRLAKQHIVYRAQLPRVSLSRELRRTARTIIHDLTQMNIDLIFCILSTEREFQFVRLVKESGSSYISQLLLNRTSWWFASRLGETHGLNYFPKIFTASEDRRRTLSHFSSTSMKMLLNAVLRTYLRLPNVSTASATLIGPPRCDSLSTGDQLRRTHMFIK